MLNRIGKTHCEKAHTRLWTQQIKVLLLKSVSLERALSCRLAAVEQIFAQLVQSPGSDAMARPQAWLLQGRQVVYVGCRPSLTPHFRAQVEGYPGSIIHHDSGK